MMPWLLYSRGPPIRMVGKAALDNPSLYAKLSKKIKEVTSFEYN
jgi:hypothetical protein